ncbi:unnamed protein product [Vitrella brassicaformis CCMP3155]|uniref:RING-type domain-containing protein n=2 Tax=Vitrella brassicaformis TaxID=1169539 RepID=A0A0G4EPQ7_VITBC|nr:unnamed protein product [Vitrella brassicaformis CCMP3155]|eukprot:CEL99546.1 unnamed protein product [Vitrella brassicaformis CCMP3155]
MSTPIALWKQLEQQLRCQICQQYMEAPVSLKCGHVFCSLCIRRTIVNGSAKCPFCQQPAKTSDLRPSPSQHSLIELIRNAADGKFRKLVRSKLKASSRAEMDQQKTPKYRNNVVPRKRSGTITGMLGLGQPTSAAASSGDRGGEITSHKTGVTYGGKNNTAIVDMLRQEGLPVEKGKAADVRDIHVARHEEFCLRWDATVDAIKCGGQVKKTKADLVKEVMDWERRHKQASSSPTAGAAAAAAASSDLPPELQQQARMTPQELMAQLRKRMGRQKQEGQPEPEADKEMPPPPVGPPPAPPPPPHPQPKKRSHNEMVLEDDSTGLPGASQPAAAAAAAAAPAAAGGASSSGFAQDFGALLGDSHRHPQHPQQPPEKRPRTGGIDLSKVVDLTGDDEIKINAMSRRGRVVAPWHAIMGGGGRGHKKGRGR